MTYRSKINASSWFKNPEHKTFCFASLMFSMFFNESVHFRNDLYDYRPETMFAKIMFSQVFVCPQGRVFVQGVSVQGVSVKGVSVQEGLCPGVSVRGSLSGGLCPGGSPSGRTPVMVTSGRYASYWNAFVFKVPTLHVITIEFECLLSLLIFIQAWVLP